MMTSETLAGGSGSKDSVAPETSLEKVQSRGETRSFVVPSLPRATDSCLNQVMSMLNKAQEQTRHPVVQSLDRVVVRCP